MKMAKSIRSPNIDHEEACKGNCTGCEFAPEEEKYVKLEKYNVKADIE